MEKYSHIPCKLCRGAHHKAGRERAAAMIAVYDLAMKERRRQASVRYGKEHPEYNRLCAHNRRARLALTGGKLSKGLSAKLFKLQRGLCPCCQQPLGEDFHLDHIMPLALGGMNIDSNIQLLRKRCNHQKSAKHPIEFMQLRGFLL
jgi:5-methylcytosine-specific restriction endonuclease McrA